MSLISKRSIRLGMLEKIATPHLLIKDVPGGSQAGLPRVLPDGMNMVWFDFNLEDIIKDAYNPGSPREAVAKRLLAGLAGKMVTEIGEPPRTQREMNLLKQFYHDRIYDEGVAIFLKDGRWGYLGGDESPFRVMKQNDIGSAPRLGPGWDLYADIRSMEVEEGLPQHKIKEVPQEDSDRAVAFV